MKTWAIYSLKGGVGKTAAAVNLACEAALDGRHVLLWDLDPQGAASWYLGVDDPPEMSAKRIVSGKAPLGRYVQHTDQERLDVLPGDRGYRHWDAQIHAAKQPRKVIEALIEPFSESYSLMILDCPPGIGSLATAVLRAADRVLVPVVPTPLSLRALDEVLEHVEDKKVGKTRVLPFFSMADRRRRMHREMIEAPPDTLKKAPETFIDYSTHVEQMGVHRAPVRRFSPRSRAAAQYRALYRELR
ncbi:ParA family protein [Salinisphaera orenii]|uniref:Chromosome partitioning protein ParA n=1 Tax=Salinisphaera orenii YIM 95161 TaxID=1051139 RepID=A0A423PPC7_9GAMM|nr:ParA family protein [Salinisphaera halophila]ROO27459.1 chromosome partitioning protein ParA [Salinisphaera halophila YIM 95161]